jgi:hypothetical protein
LSQAMHPQGWLPQQKVFSFSAYISNKLSKSVGIPSHRHGQTQHQNRTQPAYSTVTIRTRFGHYTVSDPRISPASANNTLPSSDTQGGFEKKNKHIGSNFFLSSQWGN